MKSIAHLKELNIASSKLSAEEAGIVAEEIKDNGALSKLTFSCDWSSTKVIILDATATELDLSNKGLEVAGAQLVAAFLANQ